MTKDEKLKELYDKNGLEKEDIFILEMGNKKIPIITRTGIEKIQAKLKIQVNYEIVSHDHKLGYFIVKAVGLIKVESDKLPSYYLECQTFGECSPENNKQKYPLAIAEKRALSRVVLKLSGLYEMGYFGELEADEFNSYGKNI